MTSDDLATLLRWLYANDDGSGWLPAAARYLRLNERNLRGMLQPNGVAIPPTIADVICILVASHSFLRGWHDRWQQLDLAALSDWTRNSINQWREELHLGNAA